MLKRIFLVIFILLVLMAVSGFLYMQKHPLEGKNSADKVSNNPGSKITR
ncbi:hypothetical protein [Chryseobacterium elymi]|nr:hypothetical protein [Chryseobacterium elymi]